MVTTAPLAPAIGPVAEAMAMEAEEEADLVRGVTTRPESILVMAERIEPG